MELLQLIVIKRHKKCDLFGIGSMIGGFAQGALNYSAQQKANETNLRIARETNQANAYLAEKNNRYNERMWNLQNEYNSPAAQRERLEAAGLNPNLMLSGNDTGNANSSVTADQSGIQQLPAPIQAPQVHGLAEGISALDNMLFQKSMAAAQTDKTKAEAEAQKIENQYKASTLLASLQNLRKQGKLTDEQIKLLGLENEIGFDIKEYRKEDAKQSLENKIKEFDLLDANEKQVIAQTAYTKVLSSIASVNLNWLPAQLRADMAVKLTTAALNSSGAQVNLANELKIYAETHGIKISNHVAEQTAESLIHSLNATNENTSKNKGFENSILDTKVGKGIKGFEWFFDKVNPLGGLFKAK